MALADIKFTLWRGCRMPHSKMDEWQKNANDYRVTLGYRDRKIALDFFTGKGWKKDPELLDVLDSILSDANCEHLTFEEFCGEFGYNSDSRRAERVFHQLQAQSQKLRQLFGDELEAIIDEYTVLHA